MPKIKVELNHEIIDGQPITFVAPCDCSETDGLRVSYPGGTKDFVFKDAHGNDLSGIGELFLSGAYVRVLVNTVNSYAYIQNADTNKYIEDTFLKKAGGTMTGALNLTEPLNLESGGTGRNLSAIEPYSIIRAASNSAYLLSTPTADGAFFATGDNKAAKFGTLPVAQGGTGATTAVQALANLFALNLNDITDERFMVQYGDDYDNYTTPGAYRIATAAIASSLLHRPSYASAGGRLIVSATSSNSDGRIQIVIFNTLNYQIHFRIKTSTGTWGEWDYIKTSNHMTDYVVAEGESDKWYYRKWNSGIGECWYNSSFTTTSHSQTPVVYPYMFTQNFTFPFDFTDNKYTAVATVTHSSGHGIVTRINHASANAITILWEGNVANSTATMSIYVIGKY